MPFVGTFPDITDLGLELLALDSYKGSTIIQLPSTLAEFVSIGGGSANLGDLPAGIQGVLLISCGLTVMPSLTGLASLVSVDMEGNASMVGTIDLRVCTALQQMTIQGSHITDGALGLDSIPGLNALILTDDNMPQWLVDEILRALVSSLSLEGRVACNVILTGNTAPSATGLAYKATLNAVSGWSVTTD